MKKEAAVTKPRRILRKPEVRGRTGLSDATIARLEAKGKFPKRIWVTENTVGWYDDELDEWLDSRPRVGASKTDTVTAA